MTPIGAGSLMTNNPNPPNIQPPPSQKSCLSGVTYFPTPAVPLHPAQPTTAVTVNTIALEILFQVSFLLFFIPHYYSARKLYTKINPICHKGSDQHLVVRQGL